MTLELSSSTGSHFHCNHKYNSERKYDNGFHFQTFKALLQQNKNRRRKGANLKKLENVKRRLYHEAKFIFAIYILFQ